MGRIQNDKIGKSDVINRENTDQKKEKNQEFLESVKEQLSMETFKADVWEYSYEKVEALVKIIDAAEGIDEDEIDESYRKFTENFQRIAAKRRRKTEAVALT